MRQVKSPRPSGWGRSGIEDKSFSRRTRRPTNPREFHLSNGSTCSNAMTGHVLCCCSSCMPSFDQYLTSLRSRALVLGSLSDMCNTMQQEQRVATGAARCNAASRVTRRAWDVVLLLGTRATRACGGNYDPNYDAACCDGNYAPRL